MHNVIDVVHPDEILIADRVSSISVVVIKFFDVFDSQYEPSSIYFLSCCNQI